MFRSTFLLAITLLLGVGPVGRADTYVGNGWYLSDYQPTGTVTVSITSPLVTASYDPLNPSVSAGTGLAGQSASVVAAYTRYSYYLGLLPGPALTMQEDGHMAGHATGYSGQAGTTITFGQGGYTIWDFANFEHQVYPPASTGATDGSADDWTDVAAYLMPGYPDTITLTAAANDNMGVSAASGEITNVQISTGGGGE